MARMVTSGALCMEEAYSQTRSIAKTFGGGTSYTTIAGGSTIYGGTPSTYRPHNLSNYYGAGTKNPGTTLPTSGQIKFSDFYGMAPLAKYINGSTHDLAHVSNLKSSRGEGFWRISGSVTVPADITKYRVHGSFKTNSSKIMKYKVGFAVGGSSPGYLNVTTKNYDSGYAPWQRSGSFDVTQTAYIGIGTRFEFHVWLWGNRGSDHVESGTMTLSI
jgi:hypothetical protein